MSTEFHKNIVLDLLPAYLAGEASAESCKLVEEFAKTDTQVSRLIRGGSEGIETFREAVLSSEHEMKTLKRTRKRISKSAWSLGFAIFFSLITITYHFGPHGTGSTIVDSPLLGPHGFLWTFVDFPLLAGIFALIAAFFWYGYYKNKRKVLA